MKTAIQELIEHIKINDLQYYKDNFVFFNLMLEKEKQQIIDAHGNKTKKSGGVTNYTYILTGEEYYNKKYNKN